MLPVTSGLACYLQSDSNVLNSSGTAATNNQVVHDWLDLTSNGNNASVVGIPASGNGGPVFKANVFPSGLGSLYFTGPGGTTYTDLNIAHSASLDLHGDCSGVWYGRLASLQNYVIFAQSNRGSGTGALYWGINSDGTITVSRPGATGVNSTGAITAGTFNSVMISITSNVVTFYINGAAAGSGTITSGNATTVGSDLGCYYDGNTDSKHLTGDEGAFGLYTRGITSAEATSNHSYLNTTFNTAPSGPTRITLSGPASGFVGAASTAFTATLDQPAGSGGVSVAITSTVSGDTITSTPFVIASGQSSGTFTDTPHTAGARTLTGASSGLTSGSAGYTANLAAPTITATAGNHSVSIGLPAGTLPTGATGINLKRGLTPGGESGTPIATNLAANAFPYTDGSLTAGTTYYYTAQSSDGTNLSAASAEVSATPTAGPALSVSPQTATVNQGATLAITPNLQGSSASLAAAATGGTLSTSAPINGTAFNFTAGTTPGTFAVTVTDSTDTLSASTAITIPAVAISVSPTSEPLSPGSNATPTATVTGTINTAATWTSSNPSVASVNATTGVITANNVGSATITATSAADPTKTATVAVVVSTTINYPLGANIGAPGLTVTAQFFVPGTTTPIGSAIAMVECPANSGCYSCLGQVQPGTPYHVAYTASNGENESDEIYVPVSSGSGGGSATDSPGVTSILAALAAAESTGTVASVANSQVIVNGLSIPAGNIAPNLCYVTFADRITGAFKGRFLIASAVAQSSSIALNIGATPTLSAGDSCAVL